METEPGAEAYVRLASLRRLHDAIAGLTVARTLGDTVQAVADGAVRGLGFGLAVVNMVRPDGDLVVAAVAGDPDAEALLAGRVGPRAEWERRLTMGERWGDLRYIPAAEGWELSHDAVPAVRGNAPEPTDPGHWHPDDRLFAPLYAAGHELIGVLSVDGPRNGRVPGTWGREALQTYAVQAAFALANARLRTGMQRALIRLERDQQDLRASEESFRHAFEYAPSGMAVSEIDGGFDGVLGERMGRLGRLVRVNDALCRLLGRPAGQLCGRLSLADLVHPADAGALLRTSAEGGRAELRLSRSDETWVWVSLRTSVVADAADGPRLWLTHVEDIEERKRREMQLAHRASHDALTGLPNSAELRARIGARLCSDPRPRRGGAGDLAELADLFDRPGAALTGLDRRHVHTFPPQGDGPTEKGLAVLFCDLDGFKAINDVHGHHCGDAALVEVAHRLCGVVRDVDTVARLGGDEFVVLADGVCRSEAKDLAVRLRGAILPPMTVHGRTVNVGASFGIGWAGCGMSADDVLHSADQRMYVDKRARLRRSGA